MDTSSEITDASTEVNECVLVESEKRLLEESEDNADRKKCKIDENNSNDQPAISKRQLKKIQKQQMWLEKKAQRK